jgi:hypothetical protein
MQVAYLRASAQRRAGSSAQNTREKACRHFSGGQIMADSAIVGASQVRSFRDLIQSQNANLIFC